MWGRILSILLMAAVLSGCNSNVEVMDFSAPHTGNALFELEVNLNSAKESFKLGHKKYVQSKRLRVRSTPEVREDNILGVIYRNDLVEVVRVLEGTSFIEIKVIATASPIKESNHYYVSRKYLSGNKKVVLKPETGDYFMIQNVATEKLRVYQKQCDDGNCIHKMVLETDIAVGEKDDSRKKMTRLGYYSIMKWVKFYQDRAGRYPSWYHPDYPMPPKPGASVTSWTKEKVLPYEGAKVRGAFGWYTALVGPFADGQWTHGTLGWGEDKDKYIEATRGFWANLFTDPRSSGCTRTDNESIAYVRELLPVGATLVKIYAKEAYANKERPLYTNKVQKWEYILTKNGSQQDGQLAGREGVLAMGTPKAEWLEEGRYKVDIYPNGKNFRSGSQGAISGENGNVYGLEKSAMQGVFLVDAGLVVNYAHPQELVIGGYRDQLLPPYMVAAVDTKYDKVEKGPFRTGRETIYSKSGCIRLDNFSDQMACERHFED